MENTQQYAPFDVGREVAVSLSVNNPASESPSSTLMNSASQVGISLTHHFSEGVGVGLPQQSPLFSSFLTSQPMFNGAYTSPTGFTNQNSFSAGFNSYADSSIWFSDAGAQLCVPTNQDLILTESDRKMLFSNSRIGNLETVSMCSPLPAEVYKSSINKDYLSYQSKTTSSSTGLADSQSWLCRSSIGYGTNQQNQQSVQQQAGFKCNDQYSSCSVLPTNMADHNDQKHSSATNFDNSCCVSSANNRSSNKDKEHQLKYSCCLLKGQNNLTQPCIHSPEQMRQVQDQGNFESLSTSYSSNSGIHEHMIYSQIPHIFNINNSPGQTGKKQISVRHVSPGQMPVVQQPFPEQTLSCEMMDNCYANNSVKGSSKNNSSTNGSERSSCCRLNISMSNDALSFASHPYSHRQSLHSSPDCINNSAASQLYSSNITTQYDCSLQIPKSHQFPTDSLAAEHACLDESNAKNDSPVDGSEAGDSDIVVEDTDEDSESGVSIEEINKDMSLGRCCICNSMETLCSQLEYKFVQLKQNVPVTSSSQIPIFSKLTQVFCKDGSDSEFLNDNAVLCKICHSLIDSYDCLETKLDLVKKDLLQRYSRKEVPKSLNRTENVLKEQTNQCAEKTISGKASQQTKPQVVISSNEILEEIIAQENVTINISDEKSPKKDVWRPRFECKICRKSFISKRYMRKHQQHHTKSYSFCCDRCGKGFTVRRALENHLHLHSGDYQYQCDVCGRQFIQRSSLKTHLLKHQGKFRVTCDRCGKGFMNDYSLQIHLRVHTGDRPFICQYCGKSFGNKGNLLSHVKLCSGDNNFNCNQCDKGFPLKCQFRKHLLVEHGGKYEHSCLQCGKGFMKASDCKAHMATHTGLKPHKCQDCGKCYSSVGNLNQHHSAKHKENRDLKCTICEKTFLRKTAFTEHMDFHEGKRPHKCMQCEKTFISRRNLLAHLKWHAGDIKRLTCNICGKSIKHGLEVHMRSHSGYKPYLCLKCDASFTVKSSLDKHCRSIHGEKNSN